MSHQKIAITFDTTNTTLERQNGRESSMLSSESVRSRPSGSPLGSPASARTPRFSSSDLSQAAPRHSMTMTRSSSMGESGFADIDQVIYQPLSGIYGCLAEATLGIDPAQEAKLDEDQTYTEILGSGLWHTTNIAKEGLAGKDWFHGTLGQDNVVRLLQDKQPGSFLVSISDEQRVFVISVVVAPSSIAHVFVADNNKDGVDAAAGLGQKWLINDKHFESIDAIITFYGVNLMNGDVLLEHPISKFSRRERNGVGNRWGLSSRGDSSSMSSASSSGPSAYGVLSANGRPSSDPSATLPPLSPLARSVSQRMTQLEISNAGADGGPEVAPSPPHRPSLSWGFSSQSSQMSSASSTWSDSGAGGQLDRSATDDTSVSWASNFGPVASEDFRLKFILKGKYVVGIGKGTGASAPGEMVLSVSDSHQRTVEVDFGTAALYQGPTPEHDKTKLLPADANWWSALEVQQFLDNTGNQAFKPILWANQVTGPVLLKLGGDLFDPALVSTKERRMLDEALIAQRIRMAQDTSCAMVSDKERWWVGKMTKKVCGKLVLGAPVGSFLVRAGSAPETVVIVTNDFGHLASMQTQVFQDGRAWLVGSTDGTVYDTLDNLISVLRSRFQRSKFQSSKTFVLKQPVAAVPNIDRFDFSTFWNLLTLHDGMQRNADQMAADAARGVGHPPPHTR